MNAHKPSKESGRAAFDDRGNATWEWHGETGPSRDDIDTHRLKKIGADLSLDGADHAADGPPHHDPYNQSPPPQSGQSRPKKRSLDDLRRLSEEIKTTRQWTDRRRR